jgi:hypothetical protein
MAFVSSKDVHGNPSVFAYGLQRSHPFSDSNTQSHIVLAKL